MHRVLECAAQRISRSLEGIDAETAQIHPDERGRQWNIRQIVEHLALACRFATRELEARLDKGRICRRQSRTFTQKTLGMMVLSLGYLPEGAPALEETDPIQGLFVDVSGRELGRLLLSEMEAMDAVLDRCRRKFGMERVAVHPFFGPLRVDQWRRYHAILAMQRLKQMEWVRSLVAPQSPSLRVRGGVLQRFQSHLYLRRTS